LYAEGAGTQCHDGGGDHVLHHDRLRSLQRLADAKGNADWTGRVPRSASRPKQPLPIHYSGFGAPNGRAGSAVTTAAQVRL
jgi:hypothetical protein